MTSDDSTKNYKTRTHAPGVGHYPYFNCMGCHQKRNPLGSRGVGIRRKCSVCVEKRQAMRVPVDTERHDV